MTDELNNNRKLLLSETDSLASREPTELMVDYGEIRSIKSFRVLGRYGSRVSRVTLKNTITHFLGDDNEMYDAFEEHYVLESPSDIYKKGEQCDTHEQSDFLQKLVGVLGPKYDLSLNELILIEAIGKERIEYNTLAKKYGDGGHKRVLKLRDTVRLMNKRRDNKYIGISSLSGERLAVHRKSGSNAGPNTRELFLTTEGLKVFRELASLKRCDENLTFIGD